MKKFFLGVCILLASCAPVERVPKLTGVPILPQTTETLLNRMHARESAIHSFKTLLRIKLTHGSESQSQRLAVVFQQPNSFRIEFYPTTSFYLLQKTTIRDGRFVILNMVDSEAREGIVGDETLEDVIGLPVTLTALKQILFATLPEDRYVGTLGSDGINRYLSNHNDVYAEFAGDSEMPAQIKLFSANGEKIVGAHYDSYTTIDGVAFPDRFTLDIPQHNVEIEIVASSVKVNPHVESEDFDLTVPNSFRPTR